MTDSNEDTVERIKRGEREALVEFIEQRRPQLLAFIEKNASDAVRRKIEAADLLQEVSINALSSLSDVQLGDRDPFSWLCQLAERRIIDAHRRFYGSQKRAAGREIGIHAGGDSDEKGFIDVLVA